DDPGGCQQRPRRGRGRCGSGRADRRAPRRARDPAAGSGRGPGVRGRLLAVKILVANLGSTSFKYRLFDMGEREGPAASEPLLARGAIERIGSEAAKVVITSPRGRRELVCPIADHGAAVQLCLDQLTDPEIGVLAEAGEVAAIGFKAVHARNL